MGESIYEESLKFHEKYRGKISVDTKVPLETKHDLSMAYTPGVSRPCVEISKDKNKAYAYTAKGNLVAVITDGSAVLGLGDIGPEAAMPVMEGKAILFKKFGGIDAFPICVSTKDPEEFVQTVVNIAASFGGINLEDISAPRCFDIENQLKKKLDIPVFHDDQHGTAIVAVAAIINALKIAKKEFKNVRIVVNGAGAAGIASAKLLQEFGAGDIILCDTKGIIYEGRKENMSTSKNEIAKVTNRSKQQGTLEDAIKGADIFLGVSSPKVLTQAMVKKMAPDAIVFALSNPVPEILPQEAKEAGALVVGTGRSDFPNQVNNVLAFPGIFRGALNVRASDINEEMKQAAAIALASLINDNDLTPDYVIPHIFDPRVVNIVAPAVELAARQTGVARL